METVDIRGVPTRIWKNAPPSLRCADPGGRAHGDRLFTIYEDERVTYEATVPRGRDARGASARAGGGRRATASRWRCATCPNGRSPSSPRPRIGAIMVPLNAWWTGGELEYGLRRFGREGADRRRRAASRGSREHYASAAGARARASSRAAPQPLDGDARAARGCDRHAARLGDAARRARCPRSRSRPTTMRRSSTPAARPARPRARSARTAT